MSLVHIIAGKGLLEFARRDRPERLIEIWDLDQEDKKAVVRIVEACWEMPRQERAAHLKDRMQ
jgi:hypothetical protein